MSSPSLDSNPLREGIRLERTAQPCAVVIFGASGDLTKRKLVPALWSLFQGRVLPEPFAVIGVARSEMTNETFRARMREAISDFARVQPPSERVWQRFASSLFYQAWAIAMPGPYRYLLGLLLGTIILDYYLAIWIER